MPALLALASAATFGVADFLGGLATRKAHVLVVTLLTNLAGGILALVVYSVIGGEWTRTTVAWSVSGGLFGLLGLMLLYSGLAVGPNKLVSPVSAVVSAVVPVATGLALGERPGLLAALGLALTPPAIWFLAGGEMRLDGADRKPLVMAVGAGMGFGLFFTFLAQVPEGSGAVPLVVARVASISVLVVAVLIVRPAFPALSWSGVALAGGALDMTANGLFLWAVTDGELTIVGALSSLFPATTVILAVTTLGERLTRTQIAGLTLALGAAALLS